MSGFGFVFFFPYTLLKRGHLLVCLICDYVYLVFPNLHLFNFKSIFIVTHRKQTYTSSQDDFTLTKGKLRTRIFIKNIVSVSADLFGTVQK